MPSIQEKRDNYIQLLYENLQLSDKLQGYSDAPTGNTDNGLPSPENTPDPELERAQADVKRQIEIKKKEITTAADEVVKEEIERIIKCTDDNYDAILDVDPKAEDKGCIRDYNWVKISVLLLSNDTVDNSKQAYEKIEKAANSAGVHKTWITAIKEKNGKVLQMVKNYQENAPAAKTEIQRILSCPDANLDDILQVDAKLPDKEKETARYENMTRKGCLIHKNYYSYEKAKEAYEKLIKTATSAKVEDIWISGLENWNGFSDLLSDEDEGFGADPEYDLTGMDEDIECPPERIKDIYNRATPFMKMYMKDPENSECTTKINTFNKMIEIYVQSLPSGTEIPSDKWVIKKPTIVGIYKLVLQNYADLFQQSAIETPAEQLDDNNDKLNGLEENQKQLELLKQRVPELREKFQGFLERHHYPGDWGIQDALYYQNADPNPKSIEPSPPYNEKQPEGQMVYPWETLKHKKNTSRIIGVRLAGRGKQVCIETWEDWRWVRRLEGASECEFDSGAVDQYYDLGNSKKLSAEQSKWTFEYRKDFIKLHWVTKGRIKQRIKNTTRCPNTYCCVEFDGKGIQILSLSSFRRVRTDADELVQEVCLRDGIPCPWEVLPFSGSPNWTKRAKTVKGRRALEDQITIKSEEGNNPSSDKVVNSDVAEKITDLLADIKQNIIDLAKQQVAFSTALVDLTTRLTALENKPST